MTAADKLARLEALAEAVSTARDKNERLNAREALYSQLDSVTVGALVQIAKAADDYQVAADWYRRCLEGVIDRSPVRGLAEARAAFDNATDALRAARALLGGDA